MAGNQATRFGFDVSVQISTLSQSATGQKSHHSNRRVHGTSHSEKIVAEDRWIIEGDLGHHDAVEVRLQAADTIILLDFSLLRCAVRAIRRSRERSDFWFWLIAYRYQTLPILREAISKYAQKAAFHVFRDPRAMDRFVADVSISSQ
jgi:hypothetical protein